MSSGEEKKNDDDNLTPEDEQFLESYYEYALEKNFKWILKKKIVLKIFKKILKLEPIVNNDKTELTERIESHTDLQFLLDFIRTKISINEKDDATNKIKENLGLGEDETVYMQKKKSTLQLQALKNISKQKSRQGGKHRRRTRKKKSRKRKTKRRRKKKTKRRR